MQHIAMNHYINRFLESVRFGQLILGNTCQITLGKIGKIGKTVATKISDGLSHLICVIYSLLLINARC